MIRSLSPYNYTTSFRSGSGLICQSYRLDLRIWNGAKAGAPTTVTESWTKLNPTGSDGNDIINIARVLADYVEVTPPTGTGIQLINGNAQWWVKTEVVYFTDPNNPTTSEPPQDYTFNLFGRGYSYGNEGQNITTVTDNLSLDGREFKVNRNGIFILPYYTPDNTLEAITVNSFPAGEVSQTPVPSPALSQRKSNESTQYLWVDVSTVATDKTIEIVLGATDPAPTVTLLIEDEYKHVPMDIVFINKYGVCQTLTFFKEFESELKVTREKYETDNGQPSAGHHQFRNINVQGQESFKIQSGWVDESMNETFKQLLLSEQVWHYDGASHIPLNLGSSSLNYKTQKRDRLIQYEIDFEYSFNVINNI
jgi:hypothetical protein